MTIRAYLDEDWRRLCAIHDAARRDELAAAGLSAAFLTLEETAENEGPFGGEVLVGNETALSSYPSEGFAIVKRSDGRLAVIDDSPLYRWPAAPFSPYPGRRRAPMDASVPDRPAQSSKSASRRSGCSAHRRPEVTATDAG